MDIDNKKIEEYLKHSLKKLFNCKEDELNIRVNFNKVSKNNLIFLFKKTWDENYDEEQIANEILEQIKKEVDKNYLVHNAKAISKIINKNFNVILLDKDNIMIEYKDKYKKINKFSSLNCFKNNDTKEILDLIRSCNKEGININEDIIKISLGLINREKEIDYLKIIEKQFKTIKSSEIIKYFQILSNKIILRFNLPIKIVNQNLLNRRFYFKYFQDKKISEKGLDLTMIHSLTKNFSILRRSIFLEKNKYFNDDSIKKTEKLINDYLDFLEKKISKELNTRVQVKSCNTLTKEIKVIYEKDNELLRKIIKY